MDFQPKVRHQDAKLFYIGFGAFFLLGLASFIFNDDSLRLHSLLVMGFSGLMLFLMWQQAAAFDMRYRLLEEGIFLKRFFWTKTIPYREIQKIEIIDQADAASFINKKYGEEVQKRNQLDFGAFKKRKQVNAIIQFTSVPIIFNSVGGEYRIVSHGVSVNTDLILIETKDEQNFLISPEMMEEFVAEVKKRMLL